jgi:hypothetical protein
MFKLGQLDYSPGDLSHLPADRRRFISFARDAIAQSSAPTLTTNVSLKYISQAGLDFITSDTGLERTQVKAELTSVYSRPEIRAIAEQILQTQRDQDIEAGVIFGGPITPQEITAKADEIQNLSGKISFNPETRSYEFQSTDRAFLPSGSVPLEVYRTTVPTPVARDYLRTNIQESVNPANNRRVNFRSRNIRNSQPLHFQASFVRFDIRRFIGT